MKNALHRWAVASMTALVSGILAATPASADATGKQLTVVELFTSLACSTCPPADDMLAVLAERDDVLALSFHVDYWDYAGWSDPYADPAYTARQERYLRRLNMPYMITPQMIIDGIYETTGNNPDKINELIDQAGRARRDHNVAVELKRTGHREVQVKLPAMDYAGQAEVIVIRFDAMHETQVSGGDNSGRSLTNVNVVRQFKIHSLWKGNPITFDVPLEYLGPDDLQFYAVIVQEPNQGHILGANYIDLRSGA